MKPLVPFPPQQQCINEMVEAIKTQGYTINTSATGCGKCWGKGTPMLKYDGTIVPVETLKVGDQLMGPDSKPRTITSLAHGEEEMYKVIPRRGKPWTCNASHILTVQFAVSPAEPSLRPFWRNVQGKLHDYTISEFMAIAPTLRKRARLVTASVDFEEKELPLDPYFVGAYLGDGTSVREYGAKISINVNDHEIKEAVEETCRKEGWKLTGPYFNGVSTQCAQWHIIKGKEDAETPYRVIRRVCQGDTPYKTILHNYLTASREDRLQLLAGLIDTDGCYYAPKHVLQFSNTNEDILKGVQFLANSLGLKTSMQAGHQNSHAKSQCYLILITGPIHIIPTRLKRKQIPQKAWQGETMGRVGDSFKLEPIGKGEYFGFTLKEEPHCLLGDFTITHNTLCAIETSSTLNLKPLVVCPAIVVTQWKRAFEQQGVEYIEVLSWEKVRRGGTPYYKRPTKIPKSRVVFGTWNLPNNSLLIFDESHKAKTYGSQSNIMALTAAHQGLPTIMLSATPFISPLDMSVPATYAKWIQDPRRGFWLWARMHGCTDCFWGGIEFKLNPRNHAMMESLKQKLYTAGVMTEIDKEKLDTFFPENRIEYLSVDVDMKGMREIKQLQKALDKLDKSWDQSIERANEKGTELPAIVELLRLRQQSELAKLPALSKKAVELLDSGYSVVIFLAFIDSLDSLSNLINEEAGKDISYSEISGRVTGNDRDNEITKFQNNTNRLALVQISAGGAGVSLHDTTGSNPRASLINLDFSLVNLVQAQGRIARLGAKSHTLQYIVTASGTVEERIIQSLNIKEICFNALTSNGQ